jgi:hypothetical protein
LGEILADLGRASPRADARRLLAESIGLITLARAEPDRSLREEHLARAREDLWAAYGALRAPQEDQAPTAARSIGDRLGGAGR